MKTTLLVENNLEFEDFFTINLHTWVGSMTLPKKDGVTAIKHLQDNHKSIDLIITRAKIGTEDTAQVIKDFIAKHKLDTPLIVIGESPLQGEQVVHLNSALDIKELITKAAKGLNVTAQDMVNKHVPEFFPMPIQHFRLINQSICDIYREEGNEYKLYLNALQEFSQVNLKQCIAEGHNSLFVKKENRLKFLTNINQEIASKLELKEINQDEQMTAVEMSQSLLQEKISRLGLTEETIELSLRNLKFMVKEAKKNVSLKDLLKQLLRNKAGYQFKHSQILMFVATQLMDQMDWVNDEQRKKLQFIAFWHDIALENSEQAMIHTDQQLKDSNFSTGTKDLIRKHAQIGASIISQYPNAPLGVEQIIKQHHGASNGLGFSEYYSQNISPLAIVFILSEDFVDSLIQADKDFNPKAKIVQMRKRYTTQRFQKIINALESIII
jgi:HD-GYP domain-containing protein (c-di-GMP phosphodiesterase class II)